MTRVALVSGFWGQNIGNAFFNLGGESVLRATAADVHFVQDQPAYWTFRDESKGSYPNSWPLIEHLDVDLVVLQGPLFTRNVANIWRKTLAALRRRGVGYGLLSCGFRSYSNEELTIARQLIEDFPPQFVSTRDRETASRLAPYFSELRSGIDSAFFLPKGRQPAPVTVIQPFINFCFDHFVEPDLVANPEGVVEIGGERYALAHPRRLQALSSRSKAHAYISQVFDRRNVPDSLNGRTVVRPEHRTNPHLPFKIYQRPNAIASDEPWTYLALYSGGELTLSDRVHACVATLAYGGEALLYNPTTKRSALFESVGAERISEVPTRIDLDFVEHQFADTVEYLEKRI